MSYGPSRGPGRRGASSSGAAGGSFGRGGPFRGDQRKGPHTLSGGPGAMKEEYLPEHREKTLYIGNMDKRITEYALLKLFKPFGEIVRCQYLWHQVGEQKGTPRGYSFLEYKTREEAENAKKNMDGKSILGRRLAVRMAEEKDAPDIQFKSLHERRQNDMNARGSHSGSRFSADDKIRAIEEKLRRMEQEHPKDKPNPPAPQKRDDPPDQASASS